MERISAHDRQRLRTLAATQASYAALPEMQRRAQHWREHNDLQTRAPVISFETWTCEKDLLPPLECTGETARQLELSLLRNILCHEKVGDDTVIAPWFGIESGSRIQHFGLDVRKEEAEDSAGGHLGHHFLHPIHDLENDLPKLGESRVIFHRGTFDDQLRIAGELFDDVLPVRPVMGSPCFCLTQTIVHLMGMENMFYAMMDTPEAMHALCRRLTDDMLVWLDHLESERLVFPNGGIAHLNQGSMGFTGQLPGDDHCGPLAIRQCWGYMDSQETVSVSPAMISEFFAPYYTEVAARFGLLSYGCCEPVHPVWESYVRHLPNLRKVSVSPWCDEAFMGQALQKSGVIFHRKPSPNFVGVGKVMDEDAFRAHIRTTLNAAAGCHLEFSFRDIYTTSGDPQKPARAVSIVRDEIQKHWS